MSKPTPLEKIRSIYQSFLSGDLPTVVQAFAANGVVRTEGALASIPWHVPAQGHDAINATLMLLASSIEFQSFNIVSMLGSNDQVAARVEIKYLVRATQRVVEECQVHWWSLDPDALSILSLTHFEDTAQVARAADADSHVRELLRYTVTATERDDFLARWQAAAAVLQADAACVGLDIAESQKTPGEFMVRIDWRSTEAHLQDFRNSPAFASFMHHVAALIPKMSEMQDYDACHIGFKKS